MDLAFFNLGSDMALGRHAAPMDGGKQALHAKRGKDGTAQVGAPRAAFADLSNNARLPAAALGDGKGADLKQARAPLGEAAVATHQPAAAARHHKDGAAQAGQQHAEQQRFDRVVYSEFNAVEVAAAKQEPQLWVDVDALNHDDPQACSHYANDICDHLREAERTRRADPQYLDRHQPDVNPRMRAILVDWLVEVAEEYRLCADTLYQTVNYLDRYLSLQPVQRSQLQLVGVTCMWIASKYEEIYPPNVADFAYITDNTYTKEQMIQMEEIILKRLSYELTVPTAKAFLRRLLQVCNPDEELHFLSNYLTELSLLDHTMLSFLPSEIAAAAVFLAHVLLRRQPWDATLQYYSKYAPRDLEPCVHALAALHGSMGASTNNLAALREKYGAPRFHSVSRHVQPLASVPDMYFR